MSPSTPSPLATRIGAMYLWGEGAVVSTCEPPHTFPSRNSHRSNVPGRGAGSTLVMTLSSLSDASAAYAHAGIRTDRRSTHARDAPARVVTSRLAIRGRSAATSPGISE